MGKKKKVEKKLSICEHKETTPIAYWIDSFTDEAWLLQVCDACGDGFLLMGSVDFTIT